MKFDLELFDEFSSLFPPQDIREDLTKSSLAFGFECGEGWYALIHEMLVKLKALNCKGLQIDQVKEKFGTLRVYYHMEEDDKYDEVNSIIADYETMSEHTCEVCGAEGKMNTKGWFRVLCEDHTNV